ncbi:hypothetical protein COTS27_00649 [Spirochaetota bacterium]|nr:hypothetical protein COTS27_00649 [Spirochaetota bacterium]
MNIVIMGGTGFIGTLLTRYFQQRGHNLTISTRQSSLYTASSTQKASNIKYIAYNKTALSKVLRTSDVVINLSGTPLATGRWTMSQKKRILTSRVKSTQLLNQIVTELATPPKLIINASAIGIYPEATHSVFAEHSLPSVSKSSSKLPSKLPSKLALTTKSSFLTDVCTAWEGAFYNTKPPKASCRKVCLRIPVVLERSGGLFAKLYGIYKKGGGAILGTGRQGLTWVHGADFVRLIDFIIQTPHINGTINASAPYPVEMRVFAEIMAKRLQTSLLPRIPTWIVRLAAGERSFLLTEGAYIIPDYLLRKTTFRYNYPTIEKAMANLIPS